MEFLRQFAALCGLMIVLGVVLIATGSVGPGLLVLMLVCFVAMVWMLRAQSSEARGALGRRRDGGRPR